MHGWAKSLGGGGVHHKPPQKCSYFSNKEIYPHAPPPPLFRYGILQQTSQALDGLYVPLSPEGGQVASDPKAICPGLTAFGGASQELVALSSM